MAGWRAVWVAVITAIVTACAAGSGSTRDPRPKAAAEEESARPRRMQTMVVMRDAAGFARGDTVRVDLADISSELRVRAVEGGGAGARIPLAALGPTGVDSMVVATDRVNVRRCRSRGCTLLGYVSRGQLVQVHDFIGGWFRFTGSDGTRGYIRSDHLESRPLYLARTFDEIEEETAAYYREQLAALQSDGDGPLFSGYEVSLEDSTLAFEFFTPHTGGDALVELCNATRGIVDFVEKRMAQVPPGVLGAYAVGVYVGRPGSQPGEMIAGPSGGGGVYCKTPQ